MPTKSKEKIGHVQIKNSCTGRKIIRLVLESIQGGYNSNKTIKLIQNKMKVLYLHRYSMLVQLEHL
jgi:hypothetical protein